MFGRNNKDSQKNEEDWAENPGIDGIHIIKSLKCLKEIMKNWKKIISAFYKHFTLLRVE